MRTDEDQHLGGIFGLFSFGRLGRADSLDLPN